MSNTVNNSIPFVPENTIDPAAGLNESLLTVDTLLQLAVVSVGDNTPPGSPANGARYVVGTAPTGAWAGRANQVAQRLDGAWRFYAARYVLNLADGLMYVRQGATWGVAAAEWTAETVSQAEAEAGTATTRRAWTAERVRQALVAWWNGSSAKTQLDSATSNITGLATSKLDATANAVSASKLQTARTIALAGDVTGSASFDGSGSVSINAQVADDSHTHSRGNLGLGTAATKNVGTSIGDVVEVEAFGLKYAKKVTNFGERIDSGFYLSAGGYGNRPTGMEVDGGWMINLNWSVPGYGNRYNCAFYGNVQNNFIGFRRINNSGEPQAPVELYHTGNLTPNVLATYTLATLPSAAANPRLQVYCSNLAGQPAPVYSDGTNWRRVSGNTIAN